MKILVPVILFLILLYLLPMSYLNIAQIDNQKISVAIQGAVEEDTILKLPRYSTINDALDQIELDKDADTSSLNRLTILKDGDVIVIPSLEKSSKVSINYATKEELMEVKGIGEEKAQKIIDYRQEHGLYQALEDLMNIPGIKQKTFDSLKDYLTL